MIKNMVFAGWPYQCASTQMALPAHDALEEDTSPAGEKSLRQGLTFFQDCPSQSRLSESNLEKAPEQETTDLHHSLKVQESDNICPANGSTGVDSLFRLSRLRICARNTESRIDNVCFEMLYSFQRSENEVRMARAARAANLFVRAAPQKTGVSSFESDGDSCVQCNRPVFNRGFH